MGEIGRRLKSQRPRGRTMAKPKRIGGIKKRFKSQSPRVTPDEFFETWDLDDYYYPGQSLNPNRHQDIGGGEVEVSNDDDEVVLKLCELALKSFEDSHPGEKYEFVGVKTAKAFVVGGFEYKITFEAKNLKGDVKTFEAVGLDIVGEELEIEECVMLK